MSEQSILDTTNKGTPARGNRGWLYPLGIGLRLVPVALLIAFGFTQCPLVAMCDTAATTRTRRELGTRYTMSD